MALSIIFNIWNARLNILRNKLKNARRHSRLKIIVVWLMVIGLFAGTFYVPFRAFVFLNSMGHFGLVIIDRLMYLFFMGLFMMLVFSNCIICYSTAYKTSETQFFLSLPIRYSQIFLIKFIDSITLSSWMFLCFLMPILSAYALVRELGAGFYLALILFFIPFAVICAAIGCMATMLTVRFLTASICRMLSLLVLCLFLAGCVWLLITGKAAARSENEVIFLLTNLVPHFGFSQFAFAPNFWISEGLFKIMSRSYKQAVLWWLLLTANALFLSQIVIILSRKFYYSGWLKTTFSANKKIYLPGEGLAEKLIGKLTFVRPCMRSLIIKDIKIFWRDPMQWSQFAIFFGLLAIYFANIRNLGYQNVLPFWKNLISFLNLTSTNLTLASLSVRFMFPQLSLEGKRFWILGLAPIEKKDLLIEKFWLNSTVALCISLPLIGLSNLMLKVSVPLMFLSMLVVVMMCFSLTSLCIGLGALFPNFKEDNPAQIVSGFGGTLALVLCLVYIAVNVTALGLPFHLLVTAQISQSVFNRLIVLSSVFVCVFSAATIFISMLAGYRALERLEI
ncbi:MAG: hypothetical protein L6416_09335 [Candidatus Omnitrophica bacterium]|nr:hypothetical protein [Candidatus Omnitrophota bacterium]